MGRKNHKGKPASTSKPANRTVGSSNLVPLHPSEAATVPGLEEQIARIRQAMERGSDKSALELAKTLHKQVANQRTEALLIDAYNARVEGMLAKGMVAEAKALADLVSARFGGVAERMAQLRQSLACKTGDIPALVRPLTDPDLPRTQREGIERTLQRELVDLRELAECSALPQDHRLRCEAAALNTAWMAVTTGPVDESVLALPEVSRKSPLAPWKVLIRAVACVYRGLNEECLRHLEALDSESAPARLVPILRVLAGQDHGGGLSRESRRLLDKVQSQHEQFRTGLARMDEAWADHGNPAIYRSIEAVVRQCRQVCPDLLVPLQQRLSIKAYLFALSAERIVKAIGGHALHNAAFWRLMARATEMKGDAVFACALWDRFRAHAVLEGLLDASGPEAAFLYRHMATALSRTEPENLLDMQEDYLDDPPDWDYYYQGQPTAIRTLIPPEDQDDNPYYVYPDALYERACTLEPDAETYRQWLNYADTVDYPVKRYDDVALQWARAFPQDPRPLLRLAQAAEKRNAFSKALRYIDQAEQLGGADPRVGKARLRLVMAKTLRHLTQGQLSLVLKDFAEMATLPQAREKDVPVVIETLQMVRALRAGHDEEAERFRVRIATQLGSEVVAYLVIYALAHACKVHNRHLQRIMTWLGNYQQMDLMEALARAWPIVGAADLEMFVPSNWKDHCAKWLKRKSCSLGDEGLSDFTAAALRLGWQETAFQASGHGLRRAGQGQARFLRLRAMSLPIFEYERRDGCFAVAIELARRQRDMTLVSEIVDEMRTTGRRDPFGFDATAMDSLSVDDEQIQRVLAYESQQKKYPVYRAPQYKAGLSVCQCPTCRRARAQGGRGGARPVPRSGGRRDPNQGVLFDDLLDEELDEELDVDWDEPESDDPMPAELAAFLMEIVRLNGGRPPASESELDRIMKKRPELAMRLMEMIMEYGDELADLDFPGGMGTPRRSRRKKKRGRYF